MDNNVFKAVAHARERMRLATVALDSFDNSNYSDTESLYIALEALEDKDGCLQEDIHDALRLINENEIPEYSNDAQSYGDDLRRLNDLFFE